MVPRGYRKNQTRALRYLLAVMLPLALGACSSSPPEAHSGRPPAARTAVEPPQKNESPAVRAPAEPAQENEQAGGARDLAAGGDCIVLLRAEYPSHWRLEQTAVGYGGELRVLAQAPLPDRYGHYWGPVATSSDTCITVGEEMTETGVYVYAAFQLRLSTQTVAEIGAPSQAVPWPTGDFGRSITSYSPLSGAALLSHRAPEGLSDPYYVWVPGSALWRRFPAAYPALDQAADWISAACFSPDGSLLAAAAGREVLIYSLKTGELRTFEGPRHSVWSLCISQDNSELFWTDTDWPDRVHPHRPKAFGPVEAGFGVLSLQEGTSSYWAISEEKGLPLEPAAWAGWGDQAYARCAFSTDGQRVYVQVSNALVRLSRDTRRWDTIVEEEGLVGFAVVPADANGETT
jgi:hypothetical protein